MPNTPVTLHRWQVVAAFLLVIASSIAVALWNDKRIDDAEQRIVRNQASIADLRAVNARQDAIRVKLVGTRRAADIKICRNVEALKERIRATVLVNKQQFASTLAQLGISPTSAQGLALLAQAKTNERETLVRFRASNCKRLAGPP